MAKKTTVPAFEGRSAGSWLRGLVLGPDDESRFEAAQRAFAAMGEAALPWLAEELSKDTLTEARAAKLAQAVCAIGPRAASLIPSLLPLIEKYPESITYALSTLGDQAIPALIRILRHPNRLVRMRACEYVASALRSYGLDRRPFLELVPELLGLLQHEWHMLRWRSALLLGALGAVPDQCIPALMHCLDDPFPGVQGAAATALGGYGDVASLALPRLFELSKAAYQPLRCTVISALGYFSDPRVMPVLLEALRERDLVVRISAIYSLGRGKWPPDVLVPVLCNCIKDGDYTLSWAATGFLGRLGGQASAAVPVLRSAMAGARPELKELMLKTLDQIGGPGESCSQQGRTANKAPPRRRTAP